MPVMAQKATSTIGFLQAAAPHVRAAEVHGCCCAPIAAEQPPPAEQPARGSPAANSCGGFKANTRLCGAHKAAVNSGGGGVGGVEQ